jgi:hypothetical protein
MVEVCDMKPQSTDKEKLKRNSNYDFIGIFQEQLRNEPQ